MTPKKPTDLMRRLEALNCTEELLSAVTGIPIQRVTDLTLGVGEPLTGDERVRLRFLRNEISALAAIRRIRSRRTQSLQGERHDGVTVGYAGGYAGPDGTVPQ